MPTRSADADALLVKLLARRGSTPVGSKPFPSASTPSGTEVAVALVLTGHLRTTCDDPAASRALQQQVDSCRRAVAPGRCDIFIHTWDILHPTLPSPHSAICAASISRLLRVSAFTVEQQAPTRKLTERDSKPWGLGSETLANFRFNVASMLGGLRLMSHHLQAMGYAPYAAAVRMRLDLGTARIASRSEWRNQFLNATGWAHVVRRANASASGALPPALAAELVQCRHPTSKRTDFCFWSAPPRTLLKTLRRLEHEGFDELAYGRSGCRRYLRASRFPRHSENLLLCAMRAEGVSMSRLIDERSTIGENECRGWQECGLGWPTSSNLTVGASESSVENGSTDELL